MGVISGVITVRVRGGGVPPARFPAGGTTGKQLLQVLRGMPDFGDGTVDDALDGYSVPPSDEALKEGIYFFLPGQSMTSQHSAHQVVLVVSSAAGRVLREADNSCSLPDRAKTGWLCAAGCRRDRHAQQRQPAGGHQEGAAVVILRRPRLLRGFQAKSSVKALS